MKQNQRQKVILTLIFTTILFIPKEALSQNNYSVKRIKKEFKHSFDTIRYMEAKVVRNLTGMFTDTSVFSVIGNYKKGFDDFYKKNEFSVIYISKDSTYQMFWNDTNNCYARPTNAFRDIVNEYSPVWIGRLYFNRLFYGKSELISDSSNYWVIKNSIKTRAGGYISRYSWVNKNTLLVDSIYIEKDVFGDNMKSHISLSIQYVTISTNFQHIPYKSTILNAHRKFLNFDI